MILDDAQPLDQAHDPVNSCAHVVRSETADEGVEGWGRWADAEEKRYFDEYER